MRNYPSTPGAGRARHITRDGVVAVEINIGNICCNDEAIKQGDAQAQVSWSCDARDSIPCTERVETQ